jgi:hypothetical protein
MAKTSTKEVVTVDKDLIQIDEIKKGLGDLVSRMGAVKVKTQEDYDLAVSLGKEGATSLKALKSAGEVAMAPYKKGLEKIKSALSGITNAIETASDAMREECRKFIRAEEEKKQKALRELAEKQRLADLAIANANTAKEQDKAVKKAESIQTKIEFKAAEKTDNSARFRKVEVIDESLVPREYLSVDMTKLNAVKGKVGTAFPTIPGVRIYDDQQVKFG